MQRLQFKGHRKDQRSARWRQLEGNQSWQKGEKAPAK